MPRLAAILAIIAMSVLARPLQAQEGRNYPVFNSDGWVVGFTTPTPGDQQCRAIAMGETSVSFIVRPTGRTPTIFVTNSNWRPSPAMEGTVTFQGLGMSMALPMEWYIDFDPRWTGENALGARLSEAQAQQFMPFLIEILAGAQGQTPIQVTLPDGRRFAFNSASDAAGRAVVDCTRRFAR